MRKNFLTTGAVVALAWVSLAPLSLLFVATIASSSYAIQLKIIALLATLFSWIFLSMGMGLLWRRESGKPPSTPRQENKEKKPQKNPRLEAFVSMKKDDFAKLCLQIFGKMWPEVKFEQLSGEPDLPTSWVSHRPEGTYLVACENQKTFFGSREIESIVRRMREQQAAKGYLFATGFFSDPAREAAASASIELMDGQKTLELLTSFLDEMDFQPQEGVPTERRRHPRLLCEPLPVENRPALQLGSAYLRTPGAKARLVDLSKGGLALEVAETEELPAFFQMSLHLSSSPESLHILGEVVWHQAQAGRATKRYGISFVSMGEGSRKRLTQFLDEKEKEVFRGRRNKAAKV